MVTLVLATPSFEAAMADPNKAIPMIFEARLGKVMAGVTLVLIVFAYFSCATAIQAACARLVFAYARDKKIPAWKTLSMVAPASKAPIAALVFTGLVALVTLLFTGLVADAEAVIVSYAAVGIYVSFQLVVLGYIMARRRAVRCEGHFQLGRWAMPVAIVAGAERSLPRRSFWWGSRA
jgi:amino acid transporter